MQIKKPDSVIRDFLVSSENENDKDENAKYNADNQSGTPQRIRNTASSSDLRDIDSINSKSFHNVTFNIKHLDCNTLCFNLSVLKLNV